MKKTTLSLFCAVMMFTGANAQSSGGCRVYDSTPAFNAFNAETPSSRLQSMPRKSPVMKTVPQPDHSQFAPITETPEGKLTVCTRSGVSFGTDWRQGTFYNELHGVVTNVVVSDDHSHIYLQGPFFYNSLPERNWIVGDIEGDKATFTFPQLINVDATIDPDTGEQVGDAYYDYLLLCTFDKVNEETGVPMYSLCEKQTYTFSIGEDGSLTPLEDENIMFGAYDYWTEEQTVEGQEPGWSWIGIGDYFFSVTPVTDTVAEVPADLEYEDWALVDGISYRNVQVAFKDASVYLKGLFLADKEVVFQGKAEGDKAVFESGAYLGIYDDLITTYLYGGKLVYDEYGDVEGFEPAESLVFEYDAAGHSLSTTQDLCISTSKEVISVYYAIETPSLCVPSDDVTVRELLAPVLSDFYDASDFYGADIYFDFPMVDADRNILPTDRMYYQVIMNDGLFVFYDDEYELPDNAAECTEIPFDYTSDDFKITNFSGQCSVTIEAHGYDSLGIRTLYVNPDNSKVYSDILWMPGYEGKFSGVSNVSLSKDIVAENYYDLSGRKTDRPANGIYVKQTVYSDGNVKVSKVAVK